MNIPQSPQLHKHRVVRRFLCFLFGHKKAISMVKEIYWEKIGKNGHGYNCRGEYFKNVR